MTADYEHHAEFLLPGTLFPEEYLCRLDARTVEAAMAVAPAGAFCFTFYDLAPNPPVVGPEFEVIRKPLNRSPRHYLGGEVFTLPELRAWIDAHGGDGQWHALYANVECNGYTRAIRCCTGNWQPFNEDDVLVDMSERARP